MDSLSLFRDVALCRSLSEAAGLHGITQSAASQRIQQLEKHLGATLLDRTVRPVGLTPAGERYLKGVEDLLAKRAALEAEVRRLADRPAGVVRVGAIYSAGIGWLNTLQAGFEAREPGVEVRVVYDPPDAVHEAVVGGRADLGVVSYPGRWKKVATTALRDEPMAVVCPAGHELAASGGAVEPGALHRARMVGLSRGLPMARATARFFKEHGASPEVVETFDNLHTLKAAVLEAGCPAVMPTRLVAAEAAAGRLVCVGLTPALSRPIGLLCRATRHADRSHRDAADAFAAFLVEHADADADSPIQAEPLTEAATESAA